MKHKRRSRPKSKRGAKPVVSDKIFNIYHPELADKIEEAFESGGIKYYNFKKDTQVRGGRYMIITNMLQEVNLRMEREMLLTYVKTIISELDNSKGVVNVGNAVVLLHQMKTLASLAFTSDTMYRLASAVYFDDTESLHEWDMKHNETKIQGWKEDGTLDFFYKRPFAELVGLKNISQTDLVASLEASAHLSKEYKLVLNSLTRQADNKSSTTQE